MKLTDFILDNPKLNQISTKIDNARTHLGVYLPNTTLIYGIYQTINYFLQNHKFVIYVTSNIYHAQVAYDLFCELLSQDLVSFYPGEEFITLNSAASSNVFRFARMQTLNKIMNNTPQIIITNVESVTRRVINPKILASSIIKIQKGEEFKKTDLVFELIKRGYQKVSVTTTPGEFSERGEVLDIYPINEASPVRLNYFDDEIEMIKTFDEESQLSNGKIDDVLIFPVNEIVYDDAQKKYETLLSKYPGNIYVDEIASSLLNYQNLEQLYIFLNEIDPSNQSFLSLIKDKIIFIEAYADCLAKEKEEGLSIKTFYEEKDLKIPNGFYLTLTELIKEEQKVYLSEQRESYQRLYLDELIDINTIKANNYNNHLKQMIEEIKITYLDKIYLLTHTDNDKLRQISDSLSSNGLIYEEFNGFNQLKKGHIYVMTLDKGYGYTDLDTDLILLTPNEYLSNKIHKSELQKYYLNTIRIYHKDELTIGDYVVVDPYGIGIYDGIIMEEIGGFIRDALVIKYDEGVLIQIPAENIYMIEKYIPASDTFKPKLSKIGSKTWTKKKQKIKEKVSDLAERLIKIERARLQKVGYIYPSDSEYQKMFEEDFEYPVTIDQQKAIDEIKKELESGKLIDRLICGDVGFGKTEVAMRAAFKVVEGGKQVAYLAPTTVLTRQHYYTFKDRFEKYGIKVELLNRFVPLDRQKEIIKGIKSGYVDIVIATHRLFNNEISFKDLGLLIIDEEQRFGVEHKERFKELKHDVNVLSLSATPIPRTLQMSLVGIKDLSLIETPPVNRYPIQTYVMQTSPSVIREAINRELGRGGQVFYLLNRIEELEKIINKVHSLVPNARIGLIHGRLSRDEIEVIISEFIAKKIDVLMCTTIIETGIDIPNANTLIIERADILGLSQLYQIRGRVGRSDRLAYAYLLYNKESSLNPTSLKRLNTIKEFTTLGSGYKIAMRDLTIRGAGDILGAEQSGYINDVGINTYMKILNEAIIEKKGLLKQDSIKHYRVNVTRHIDEVYVGDDGLRIEMHSAISQVKSRMQQTLLINEFVDRYGSCNDEIKLYIEAKYLEYQLSTKHVDYFEEARNQISVMFDEKMTKVIQQNAVEIFNKMMDITKKIKTSLVNNKALITLNPHDFKNSYIYTLNKLLEIIPEIE